MLPADHRLADGTASRGIGLDRLGNATWISGATGIPNRTCLETVAG
ncbi:type 2 periplasmic-binding domain-containing protein [Streptomyces spongiae]|nr:hypothetical protein [Streptomyces spongiae]